MSSLQRVAVLVYWPTSITEAWVDIAHAIAITAICMISVVVVVTLYFIALVGFMDLVGGMAGDGGDSCRRRVHY